MAAGARTLILSGSPVRDGRCARLAFDCARQAQAAGEQVTMLSIANLNVAPCRGCNACSRQGNACVQQDDMDTVMEALAQADRLVVVAPVFFAGPPAQLKAALDRLQPHYWAGTRALPKRPATLHVVGQGGDPHGYEPLVTIVRSALAVAGFALQDVVPHIAAHEESGEAKQEERYG